MRQAVVRSVGVGRSPVLTIDEVGDETSGIVEIAAALAPFPPADGTAYPGLRRMIASGDEAAASYARTTLRSIVPIVNAAFGTNGFDLLEASFSMVTASPTTLSPRQRSPHFDSVDPDYLAILHYISGIEGSGTAFYRQRSTGIEQVTAANTATFVDTAMRESGESNGYIGDSNDRFELISAVEAVAHRLIVYRGSLLHSGMIAPDMAFSDDPRIGRLTANFFIRARRSASASSA